MKAESFVMYMARDIYAMFPIDDERYELIALVAHFTNRDKYPISWDALATDRNTELIRYLHFLDGVVRASIDVWMENIGKPIACVPVKVRPAFKRVNTFVNGLSRHDYQVDATSGCYWTRRDLYDTIWHHIAVKCKE